MAKQKITGQKKPAPAKAQKKPVEPLTKKSSDVVPRTVIPEIVDAQAEPSDDYSVANETSSETRESILPVEDDGTALPSLEPSVKMDGGKALTSTDPIQAYLNEVRRYPLLTREQELELAKRYYDTKDPAAAQALVTANLRFVVKVAVEYSRFGARLIDLVQEGNMGLMHAVRDFNPYKGVRLITYAVWWIRGYIQEYLMKQYSLVKIGTTHNQKKLFYQLQKQKRDLEALGESPDIKLIASRMGLPEDEVQEMSQRISGRDVSLDQPMDDESTLTLKDFQRNTSAGPDEELGHAEELAQLRLKIEALRPSLNEREKILLEERLLAEEPLTLQEIGEKYGITREAVRQAEVRLMKKLKDQFTD